MSATNRRNKRLRRLWNAERRRLRNGDRWSLPIEPPSDNLNLKTRGELVADYATFSTWTLFHGAPKEDG